MKAHFLLLYFILLVALPVKSQVRWLLPMSDSIKVHIMYSGYGLPAVVKGGRAGYVTPEGRLELFDYTSFIPTTHQLAIIVKDGLYGLFDLKTGKERVPCVYSKISAFNEHLFLAGNYGQSALIRPDNSLVTPYGYACSITNAYDIILVCENDCWRILTATGESLNDRCYELLVKNGNYPLVQYKREGKYGLLDNMGTELTPALYEDVDDNSPSTQNFVVKIDGNWGLVDSTGAVLIPPDYQKIIRVSATYFSAVKDGVTWWFRADGQAVKPPTAGKVEYRGAHFFYFGDTLWNALTGVTLTRYKPTYFNQSDVAPLVATDITTKQSVYLLPSGDLLFDTVPNNPQPFKWGFSATGLMGKWGILNEKGEWTVPPRYISAKVLVGGTTPYFIVSEDGKSYQLFDRNARVLINSLTFEPEEVAPAGDSCFILRKKAQQYIVNASGRPLLDTGFQSIKYIGQGRFVVTDNKVSGVLDITP